MKHKKKETPSIMHTEELDALFRQGLEAVPEKYLRMDWTGFSRLLGSRRKGFIGKPGNILLICFLGMAAGVGAYLLRPPLPDKHPSVAIPAKPIVRKETVSAQALLQPGTTSTEPRKNHSVPNFVMHKRIGFALQPDTIKAEVLEETEPEPRPLQDSLHYLIW